MVIMIKRHSKDTNMTFNMIKIGFVETIGLVETIEIEIGLGLIETIKTIEIGPIEMIEMIKKHFKDVIKMFNVIKTELI